MPQYATRISRLWSPSNRQTPCPIRGLDEDQVPSVCVVRLVEGAGGRGRWGGGGGGGVSLFSVDHAFDLRLIRLMLRAHLQRASE